MTIETSTLLDGNGLQDVQTVTLAGERFVIIREADFLRLSREPAEPPLPAADEHGYYPAAETARAILARKIIRRRRAAGLTQVQLARRAHVRPETLNRIERAERGASPGAVEKIEQALDAAKAPQRAERAAGSRSRKRKQ
jgi:DNA-binding XRE family transcriptional regulator